MTTKHHKAASHHMEKAMHHMKMAHKHGAGKEIMSHEDGPEYGTHATMKGNAAAADTKGERHGTIHGMIPAGESEMVGKDEKFDGGRKEGICYTHDRSHYGKE